MHQFFLRLLRASVPLSFASHILAQTPAWSVVNSNPSVNLLKTTAGTYLLVNYLGVERSTDDGKTWSWTSYDPVSRDGHNASGGSVVSQFGIFVGSVDQGIWRSTDDGISWNSTLATGFGTGSPAMLSSGNTLLTTYGGFLRGIYKWNNGSSDWAFKYSPPPSVDCCSADFSSLSKDSNGAIYATASSPNHFGGVFKSTDDGETWNNIFPTEFSENPVTITWWKGNLVAVRYDLGVISSSDFGNTWTTDSPVLGQVGNAYVQDMKEGPDGMLYASVNGVGVERTSDLIHWQNVSIGLPSTDTQKLSVINGNIFVSTGGGLAVLSTAPEPSAFAVSTGIGLLVIGAIRRLILEPWGHDDRDAFEPSL